MADHLTVTVCQWSCHHGDQPLQLAVLAEHVHRCGSDLVLLPELPFSDWLAAGERFDEARWQEALQRFDEFENRLDELPAPAVLYTRPVQYESGERYNQACLATGSEIRLLDAKRHLPAEPGWHERQWFTPANAAPMVHSAGGASLGVQICSELWFGEHSKGLGGLGAQLLYVPRATAAANFEQWLAAGRVAALLSGAYCVSANLASQPAGLPRAAGQPGQQFGGHSWIINPDGNVLALTNDDGPFATVRLDLTRVDSRRERYPRYLYRADEGSTP